MGQAFDSRGQKVRQISDTLFSFWQNEEGFVKCLEEKKEMFDLSPYKNCAPIIIIYCSRNAEEYIRTHSFI